MIVILRETGCGGRSSVVTRFARGRAALRRTAKSCGPDTPMLVSNSREADASQGMTVAIKPVTGESTK
jgi:hypothetical protein